MKTRSKCEWYEHGEKSSKFFLNLEKSRSIQDPLFILTKKPMMQGCN